jgi:hypothetical protein
MSSDCSGEGRSCLSVWFAFKKLLQTSARVEQIMRGQERVCGVSTLKNNAFEKQAIRAGSRHCCLVVGPAGSG